MVFPMRGVESESGGFLLMEANMDYDYSFARDEGAQLSQFPEIEKQVLSNVQEQIGVLPPGKYVAVVCGLVLHYCVL